MKSTPILRGHAIATLALALPSFAAGPVAWGPAVHGLRVGIFIDRTKPQPELGIVLENAGAAALDILYGTKIGTGTAVDFKFIATSAEGAPREGFEINSFTPVAGLILPAIIHLEPAHSHEFHFPLKNIICVEKPGDTTFEMLLNQRYSFQVSLETISQSAPWAERPNLWLGKAISGQARAPI